MNPPLNLQALTPSQQQIVLKITQAGRPIAMREIDVGTQSYVGAVVRALHKLGVVHVAGWGGSGSTAHGLYALGAGPDVPRPKKSRAEILAQKRLYNNQRNLKLRKPAPVLPPPTLPTHTPRLGIWGY